MQQNILAPPIGALGRGKSQISLKIVSEYDQEIQQSQTADNPVAPRGRAAQPPRDTRKTNQAKQSAPPLPTKMIAILEWTQSNVQQNTEQSQTPTMGVTINKKSTTTEPPPQNGQQPKPPEGPNAPHWHQIIAPDSAVVEVQEMFSSHGGHLTRNAMYHHGLQSQFQRFFIPNFVCVLTYKRYKIYRTGFSSCRLGHAPGV